MHSYSALVPAPARISIAQPKEWRDGLEREQGPFSPAQTHVCSCCVRCADVIVTEPCFSTNALRNTAVASINGGLRRSRFFSSYVLQSYFKVGACCSRLLMNAIAVAGFARRSEASARALFTEKLASSINARIKRMAPPSRHAFRTLRPELILTHTTGEIKCSGNPAVHRPELPTESVAISASERIGRAHQLQQGRHIHASGEIVSTARGTDSV
jgi:hypothetical protein